MIAIPIATLAGQVGKRQIMMKNKIFIFLSLLALSWGTEHLCRQDLCPEKAVHVGCFKTEVGCKPVRDP